MVSYRSAMTRSSLNPPESGVNDERQGGPGQGSQEQGSSDAARRQPYYKKDSTACKDYKSKKDALARASNQHKLPVSWHLRDVTALSNTNAARAADMLTGYSMTGYIAVDAKVNTSHSVYKTADVWQHGTYLIGTIADSAVDITDLAATIYHLSTKVDATYFDAGMTSYSRFKPANDATKSRFRIHTGDATTPGRLDSTHGAISIDSYILSMPFVDAINPPMLDEAANFDTAEVLIVICCLVTRIVISWLTIRIVMSFSNVAKPNCVTEFITNFSAITACATWQWTP